ncbi:helix-turn-helix transcriptional regulator [Mycobacterium sp. SMC-4]|nr:helix-turn-helix transcriptional regulator [Mycobacterium sp. SMC-4]
MSSTGAPAPQNGELRFASTDLAATEDFLTQTYTKMSITADAGEQTQARIERRWAGSVSFDEVQLGFTMSYDAAPIKRICLCRVHEGRIEENYLDAPNDVFAPGDVTLLSPPDLPSSGRACAARYDLTMFDESLLARVATTGPGHRSGAVRLVGHRPVSADAEQQLNAAIEYVRSVAYADEPPSPLVASTTASLLAAAVLSALPNTAVTEPTAVDRNDATPLLLRRAMAYLDSHADRDIALTDIAEAIHVTPRALQYMFRRHLGLSPMAYLRKVRLAHAHRDLLRADPGTTSVQTVASRWGFPHTGRFAARYRRSYGRTPSETLRS